MYVHISICSNKREIYVSVCCAHILLHCQGDYNSASSEGGIKNCNGRTKISWWRDAPPVGAPILYFVNFLSHEIKTIGPGAHKTPLRSA